MGWKLKMIFKKGPKIVKKWYVYMLFGALPWQHV